MLLKELDSVNNWAKPVPKMGHLFMNNLEISLSLQCRPDYVSFRSPPPTIMAYEPSYNITSKNVLQWTYKRTHRSPGGYKESVWFQTWILAVNWIIQLTLCITIMNMISTMSWATPVF